MSTPGLSPQPALAGLALALAGEFAFEGGRDGLIRALTRAGARVAANAGEAPDVIVRGARSARVSALLGPGPADRELQLLLAQGAAPIIDEARLVAWLEAESGPITVAGDREPGACVREAPEGGSTPRGESARLPARAGPRRARSRSSPTVAEAEHRPAPSPPDSAGTPLATLAAQTLAATRLNTRDARAFLAARMADPRIVEPALREQVARALERVGGPEALAALAGALGALRGSRGVAEAAALGRLLARGDRLHAVSQPPLAIECEAPRERDAASDLLVLADRAGAVESLMDERGVPVLRVRLLNLPPVDRGDAVTYQLLRLAGRRRSARVWIGGLALPAALPWSVWLALLSPLTGRGAWPQRSE